MNFQSPLHRGILCNKDQGLLAGLGIQAFSPLFIGEYSATLRLPPHLKSQFSLSVPSSSGNTLQLRVLLFRQREQLPFSPLFIGEYSATNSSQQYKSRLKALSVPSSSGNTLQHLDRLDDELVDCALSVPSSSGNTLQQDRRGAGEAGE